MRRPLAQEELVSRDVAFIAKGDLEQRYLPIQERSWSILPCSRDLPGKAQSNCFKKTAFWTRHAGKRDREGAVPGREYIGYFLNQNPNLMKGLSPYQILGKLTSQTKKDMKFTGRKDR